MTNRLEDTIGKFLMIVVFFFLTLKQCLSIIAMLQSPTGVEHYYLSLISRIFGLIFLLLVVFFTVRRLPPKDNADGIEPRLTAIGGTFILMILIVLPTGQVGPAMRLFSTVLIVVGTCLSIYCLYWLGRSFSIMATARKLVTHGPYSVVRHPLYVAEAITVIGVIISNWSPSAALVGIAQFALQFRRMFNEERVLRRTFPEYGGYAKRTHMFIPFAGQKP